MREVGLEIPDTRGLQEASVGAAKVRAGRQEGLKAQSPGLSGGGIRSGGSEPRELRHPGPILPLPLSLI